MVVDGIVNASAEVFALKIHVLFFFFKGSFI